MSIARILTITGICILIAGCSPVAGFKSGAAIALAIIAAAGAIWSLTHDRQECRICDKANKLDEAVREHEEKFHKEDLPARAGVFEMTSAKKGQEKDVDPRMSQRA